MQNIDILKTVGSAWRSTVTKTTTTLILSVSLMFVSFQGVMPRSALALTDAGKVSALEQIENASFKGCANVVKYLKIGTLTIEEISEIDLIALRDIDCALAEELLNLKNSLQSSLPPTGEDDGFGATSGDETDSDRIDGSDVPGSNQDSSNDLNETGGDLGGEASDSSETEYPNGSDVCTEESSFGELDDASANPSNQPKAIGFESIQYPEWTYSGDTSFIMHHYTDDFDTEKFISVIGEQAREVGQDFDLFASVMIAQAILESDAGNLLSAQAPVFNVYGIKSGISIKTLDNDTAKDLKIDTGQNHMSLRPVDQNDSSSKFDLQALSSVLDHKRNAIDATTFVFGEGELCDYDSYGECISQYASALLSLQDVLDIAVTKTELANIDAFANVIAEIAGKTTEYSDALMDLIDVYGLDRFDEARQYTNRDPLVVSYWDADAKKTVEEERTLVDLVDEATSYLGTPYIWGGQLPGGFDCSGLVQYSYGKSVGINIPRTTYYQCLVGFDVDFNDLHMGDLLFFVNDLGQTCHVAMYLSDGYFIEAPQPGSTVKVTSIEEKRPAFAKRIIDSESVENEEFIETLPM